MNKWIKIGIIAVVVIGFTFIMAQLQENGIINKPKEKATVQNVDNKEKEEKKVIIEGSTKEGFINIKIDLGTGFSNKSLQNSMRKYIVKYLNEIRTNKEFSKLYNVCFIFNGDTNQGNLKIAQVDFDDKALSNLPKELTKENAFECASHTWINDK